MTDDDLDRIEARLAVQLPPEYRRFAADYPPDLDADTRNHDIFDSADRVIAETEFLRVGSVPEMPWQSSFVVIGDSGCGDWYFLDLDEAPAPVKEWNHETASFDHVAASINDWCSRVLSDE